VTTLTQADETDSTREKLLELHIQARVAEELSRLEARESQVLAGIEERLHAAAASEEGTAAAATDREKVRREVDALRQRLERMPRLGELDHDVEAVRQNVLGCLRKK